MLPVTLRLTSVLLATLALTLLAACHNPHEGEWLTAASGGTANTTTEEAGGRTVVHASAAGARWTIAGRCRQQGLITLDVDLTAGPAPLRVAPDGFAMAVGNIRYRLDHVADVTGVDVSRDPDHPAPRTLYTVDRPDRSELDVPARQQRALLVFFDQPTAEADLLAQGREPVLTLPTLGEGAATPVRLRCG